MGSMRRAAGRCLARTFELTPAALRATERKGWRDGEIDRERERFSDVSRPMPYALDRASRLHREEACLSLACVHRRAELERERERGRVVCLLLGWRRV